MKTSIQPRVVTVTITQEELREIVFKQMQQWEDKSEVPESKDELRVVVEPSYPYDFPKYRKALGEISYPRVRCSGCKSSDCPDCNSYRITWSGSGT